MSVTFSADVFCDNCGQWVECGITGSKNDIKPMILRARKISLRCQWYLGKDNNDRRKVIDLCPDCKPKNI